MAKRITITVIQWRYAPELPTLREFVMVLTDDGWITRACVYAIANNVPLWENDEGLDCDVVGWAKKDEDLVHT